MDTNLAIAKSRQLQISVIQIVREEYELILLSRIFESQFGKQLVFRGGTALRLAYHSPRFSDDLDFSVIKSIEIDLFKAWCSDIATANEYLDLIEVVSKRFTLFALFKVKDPSLPATISIKLEISTRQEPWIPQQDYTLMRLQSEITPITVLAQVATLARIKQEKLNINPPRIRDVFDIWYLGQQLRQPTKMDFGRFDGKEVRRELHRLLAQNTRRLIEPWLPKD